MPTTNSVPVSTTALAASTAPRRGVAASVARIMPVPYSLVTASVPSTIAVIWANIMPQVTNDSGDSSASGSLASHAALVRADQDGESGAQQRTSQRPTRRSSAPTRT